MKKMYFTLCATLVVLLSFFVFNACEKENNGSAENKVEERNMGYIPLPVDKYELIALAPAVKLKSISAVINLTCPPIGNQGSEGSCVAWGTTYAARSITRAISDNMGSYSKSTNIFSPEYVYNQVKASSSCASGAYITKALNLLVSQGVCVWNTMPYSSTNGCSTMPNDSQKASAAANKLTRYYRVSITESAIKTELNQKRPVVIGGPVDRPYYNLGNEGILTAYDSKTYMGGHCVCIVGYDDAKKAFKFQNSWGTYWGTKGFGWMSYSAISGYINEAYVMVED